MFGPQVTLLLMVSFLTFRLKGVLSLPHLLTRKLVYYVSQPEHDLIQQFASKATGVKRFMGSSDTDLYTLKIDKKDALKILPVQKKVCGGSCLYSISNCLGCLSVCLVWAVWQVGWQADWQADWKLPLNDTGEWQYAM